MHWVVFSIKRDWEEKLRGILEDTQETSKKKDNWDLPFEIKGEIVKVGCRSKKHCHRLGRFLCERVIPEEFDERPVYRIMEGKK